MRPTTLPGPMQLCSHYFQPPREEKVAPRRALQDHWKSLEMQEIEVYGLAWAGTSLKCGNPSKKPPRTGCGPGPRIRLPRIPAPPKDAAPAQGTSRATWDSLDALSGRDGYASEERKQ